MMVVQRLIRLVTALIPVKSVRKRVRRRWLNAARDARMRRLLPQVRSRYTVHAERCREKLAQGQKLRVAFLVCDASMFSGESVFQKLREDARFECEICVAPRLTRGEAFLRETLSKTVEILTARYGNAVRALYNPQTRKVETLTADIVFSTILYEDQTSPEFTVEHLSEHSLVAVLYYGYGGLFCTNESKTPFLPNVVLAWRYFVTNDFTRQMSVERNPQLAANIAVTGYCKMDRLAQCMPNAKRTRKRVIISPHHTIEQSADGLTLSTFLTHAELFLKLPEMFPEVDFVFRPHPLLFPRLATAKWWGVERTAAYRARMESFANVEFQQGGDYFATFADSDAMIHDCGSFLAEYFYTGKAQCYLLADEETVARQFLPFSRRLLAHTYRAFTDEEIIAFLRKVVVAGEDPKAPERTAFARSEVCVNHPHATDAVIADILKQISEGERHE